MTAFHSEARQSSPLSAFAGQQIPAALLESSIKPTFLGSPFECRESEEQALALVPLDFERPPLPYQSHRLHHLHRQQESIWKKSPLRNECWGMISHSETSNEP